MIGWLRALGLAWKLGGAVLLIGSLATGYFAWRHEQRMIGYQRALADVAKQDARARSAADDVLADIDACERSGGAWNVATGACD